MNDAPEKLLLSACDAAEALSISQRSLWSLTAPRGPIPALRLGNRVLYPVDGLRRWIDAQTAAAGEEGHCEK
ncbi:MAG: helix-turn-helix domain-containing protein [Pirellulales bacterium]|nr:helix-turn-helix domain-containing protein [Pirellulales bacterium]